MSSFVLFTPVHFMITFSLLDFRVAVTDQSGNRKGSVRVERTGGDFLELDSEHLTFTTEQSITQVVYK